MFKEALKTKIGQNLKNFGKNKSELVEEFTRVQNSGAFFALATF